MPTKKETNMDMFFFQGSGAVSSFALSNSRQMFAIDRPFSVCYKIWHDVTVPS